MKHWAISASENYYSNRLNTFCVLTGKQSLITTCSRKKLQNLFKYVHCSAHTHTPICVSNNYCSQSLFICMFLSRNLLNPGVVQCRTIYCNCSGWNLFCTVSRVFLVAGKKHEYWCGDVHSVEQKSIGMIFRTSRSGSAVRYSCYHNLSRITFPIFAQSWRFSVFHSLHSITPHIY